MTDQKERVVSMALGWAFQPAPPPGEDFHLVLLFERTATASTSAPCLGHRDYSTFTTESRRRNVEKAAYSL